MAFRLVVFTRCILERVEPADVRTEDARTRLRRVDCAVVDGVEIARNVSSGVKGRKMMSFANIVALVQQSDLMRFSIVGNGGKGRVISSKYTCCPPFGMVSVFLLFSFPHSTLLVSFSAPLVFFLFFYSLFI